MEDAIAEPQGNWKNVEHGSSKEIKLSRGRISLINKNMQSDTSEARAATLKETHRKPSCCLV
jgi:hypothetical protein